MRNKKNKFLSSTRWSIRYIILIPVIVCIIVVWNAFQRINEFERSHHRIAESTTVIVADAISKRISNQRRLLRIFAGYEKELIYRLAVSPNNETLKAQFDKKVEEAFPHHFSVAISGQDGIPLIDDFDDRIGELCLLDLKSHTLGNMPRPLRIHPNSKTYHIDIIVPWEYTHDAKTNNKAEPASGLLFVSFKPTFLSRLLELSSTPRHDLMLINNEIKNLIEITEKGARINLKRNDFLLTEEEQQRRLHSMPVKNTVWNVSDFRGANLFSEYRQNIINFSFMILSLFILGSILMIVLLRRAEKRRSHAEKMKEEMFSLFNHDLRAPLSSIFGFLEIYTESDLCEKEPEKCKYFANRASDNALIMRDIVDDILDVQKMEAGAMSFNFEETDIVSIVKNTIDMNAQYALKYNVKLSMISDERVIYNKIDARRIKQALTNVLSNAIKYSPEHETVIVEVIKKPPYVTITVSDKGPGIEKDFQNSVFDKFSQSKSKLTQRVGGTGLGLAIVKHIIDAHKGHVTFVTSASAGTTFKISLPC